MKITDLLIKLNLRYSHLQKGTESNELFQVAFADDEKHEFPYTLFLADTLSDQDVREGCSYIVLKKASFRRNADIYQIIENIDLQSLYQKIKYIFFEQQLITECSTRWMKLIAEEADLQRLVDEASKDFDNPIMVNDAAYKFLAISRQINYKNPLLQQQSQTGYVSEENLLAARRNNELQNELRKTEDVISSINPETGEAWLCVSVRSGKIVLADIAIVENDHPFRSYDKELLKSFSKIVSIIISRDSFYKNNKGIIYNSFFADMIAGKIRDYNSMIQRAKVIQLPLYEYNQILIMKSSLPISAKQKLCEQLKNLIQDIRWTIYEDNLVFFLLRNNRRLLNEREELLLEDFLKYNSLKAGKSEIYRDQLETPIHYHQALAALETGIALSSQKLLYSYDDVMVDYLLKKLKNSVPLEDIRPQYISVLEDYDNNKGSDLCQTLYYYLYYANDPVAAAQKMNIHYNTFLYRINKIKEMIGVDINNGDERFKIYLYLRTIKQLKNSNQE